MKKKILLIVLAGFLMLPLFSYTIYREQLDNLFTKFYDKGSYIMVKDYDSSITYINKNSISSFYLKPISENSASYESIYVNNVLLITDLDNYNFSINRKSNLIITHKDYK